MEHDWATAVRQWRRHHQLSLERAGRLIGVAHTTIRDWERGRVPHEHNQQLIAKVIGHTPIDRTVTGCRALRQLRVNASRTRESVARELAFSPSTIAAWETGRRTPTAEQLTDLLTEIGMTVTDVRQFVRRYPTRPGAFSLPRLDSLRRSQGMTQGYVASTLDVRANTYNYWESRARVPAQYVSALAQLFALSVPEFVTLTSSPTSAHAVGPAALATTRRRKGLSRRAVASHLGMPVRTLAALESGRKPITDDLRRRLIDCYRNPTVPITPQTASP